MTGLEPVRTPPQQAAFLDRDANPGLSAVVNASSPEAQQNAYTLSCVPTTLVSILFDKLPGYLAHPMRAIGKLPQSALPREAAVRLCPPTWGMMI